MTEPTRFSIDGLTRFVEAALKAGGADEASADAATRAMMHASRLGVDSHGVRLLPYYLSVIASGEVNGQPTVTVERRSAGAAVLDADGAIGHLACFRAMEEAVALARGAGVGAVTIRRMSHMGAAGSYALWAAEQGFVGFLCANSDAAVRLHDGRDAFHGTSPIAWGAPVPGERPWLLDMATSAIPMNRVLLYRSLGVALPEGVAVDETGRTTIDPAAARVLSPVGGAYGYKGAALAGLVEILSAPLTGMALSTELVPMYAETTGRPRDMGGFALAIDPGAFVDRAVYDTIIKRYVANIRAAAPAEDAALRPMAPGDREWAVEGERQVKGVPVDPDSVAAFQAFSKGFGLAMPEPVADSGR
jgi:LDH2 family malate/lactate/ureidoglycolate dehydrogenase